MTRPAATVPGRFRANAARCRRLAVGLAVAALIALPGTGRAQSGASGADAFMANLGNQVIQLIGNQQTPAAERKQFEQVFDQYMINVYWGHFNQYTGQRFVVTKKTPEGADTTLVSSQIIQPGGQHPVNVVWRVVNHGGKYQISDVSIEGVSELVSYRQEFSSVISQNGGSVSALTNQLKQKDQQIGG